MLRTPVAGLTTSTIARLASSATAAKSLLMSNAGVGLASSLVSEESAGMNSV